ncbi:MAG: sulfite exporter TauE/SafE family protein [Pseudolabrys sp.]
MDFLAGYGWLAYGQLHVLTALPALLPHELWAAHHSEITTAIAALFVGIVVGITGMGGGALMTPALIFLGVGNVSAIVTADLTAAAIYKTGGAAVHWHCGKPTLRLAALLICSSVPMAFLGPHLVRWITPGANIETLLMGCIGIATLLAATTYAWRLCAKIRRKSPPRTSTDCVVRPLPTLLVGALGGLLVGVTSVGSGSLIMITLLMLYPALPAVQLVGTDLMQAVPLVLSAAISNILVNGLDWKIAVPLTLGSVPGCMFGAKIAPLMRGSYIRRGIVVVLVMSGLALLEKAGWLVLGAGDDRSHPKTIALIGILMLCLAPFLSMLVRRTLASSVVARRSSGR